MTAAAPSDRTIHADMIPLFPPRWAEIFGEDDFGIFAEFTVKGARFVWRWILPGKFLMGSPEDETGRWEDEGPQHEVTIWRWILPGRFLMGSPEDETRRWEDEGPQHEVTIRRGFWLGETPVTQVQWTALMEQNPSEFKRFKNELRPVENVSWHDSTDFAKRLSESIPGLMAVLPTEAEWEYACRAGTQGAFHVDGSNCTEPEGKDPVLDELGWFNKNSGGESKEVRLKHPNAWGLYDMHGNVWEWCRDVWKRDADRMRPSGVRDPEVTSDNEGALRVTRGGSWDGPAQLCRAACRVGGGPDDRRSNRGLRLSAGQDSGAAEPRDAERPEGG